ncbi:hypothetical protein GQ44DRAFT_750475 [Phaeosphaeriaceae sp. PMI808]|nr:hypothetical protein GQ44DRAFT_750475 [Phaeosphaeriaceae sp. PMI808]
MARSGPASASPMVPSCSQIALAFVIVQSKPRDVAIRDYVLQLQECFKPGQPAYNTEELGHYLDLVSYWQNRCQQTQDECQRLRSINIRLERSNQALSQRTTPTPTQRKVNTPPTRTSKRSKEPCCPTAESSITQTQEGIENDYDLLEGLGTEGAALIEALYDTHSFCRQTAPDAEKLCHHLIRVSSALAKVIDLLAVNCQRLSQQRRSPPKAQPLGEDKSDFALALTVSARAFMSVLVGISRMSEISGDDRLTGLVICELVAMFKAVLLAIESCAQETAHAASTTPVLPKKGKSKSPAVVVKESMPAQLIAHFLIGLLGLLDKNNSTHQKIFDGFAFHLIERVGKHLYYCTFGRQRSTSIDESLTEPIKPMDEADRSRREIEISGIRFEVKALVLILERAMGLAPHHMNSPRTNTTRNPKSNSARLGRTLSMKSLPSAPKGRLSSTAKDRLQQTLVTCMYGTNPDDEFLDVLTKPMATIRQGSLRSVANIPEDNVEKWFKEEVWRLLGWDILSRERNL